MSLQIKPQSFLIIGLLLFGSGIFVGYNLKKCPEVIISKVSVRDSIAPPKDTTAKTLITGKPTKVKTAKYANNSKPIEFDTFNYLAPVSKKSLPTGAKIAHVQSDCRDTNYYETPKFYPDSFRAIAIGVVTNNELIHWELKFQDLRPRRISIIEKENTVKSKSPFLKAFLTGYGKANFNLATVTGGGAGGGFDFIIKDKVLLGLSAGANIQPLQPITGEAMLRCGIGIGK